jgi:predicted metal-dependent HD superfamily phosphohydrolase
LWHDPGLSAFQGRLHRELIAAYAEPRRHYHTLEHVLDCLQRLDTWASENVAAGPSENVATSENVAAGPAPAAPRALALAIWFHDAAYDPRAAGDANERASAAWAERALRELGEPEALVRRVSALVLATAHGNTSDPDLASDPQAALLLDIDLAILGAEPERYQRYAEQVRREYAHVPDAVYRAGRAAVLRGFLARPRIFLTARGAQLEAAARRNIASESL